MWVTLGHGWFKVKVGDQQGPILCHHPFVDFQPSLIYSSNGYLLSTNYIPIFTGDVAVKESCIACFCPVLPDIYFFLKSSLHILSVSFIPQGQQQNIIGYLKFVFLIDFSLWTQSEHNVIKIEPKRTELDCVQKLSWGRMTSWDIISLL